MKGRDQFGSQQARAVEIDQFDLSKTAINLNVKGERTDTA